MIYFARSRTGGPIKIGNSVRLSKRLPTILSDLPRLDFPVVGPLELLGVMDGNFDEEQAVHKRFRRSRIRRTEWFGPSRALLRFIKENTKEWDGKDDAPPPEELVVLTFECSPEYLDWIRKMARHVGLHDLESFVDQTLCEFAERYVPALGSAPPRIPRPDYYLSKSRRYPPTGVVPSLCREPIP